MKDITIENMEFISHCPVHLSVTPLQSNISLQVKKGFISMSSTITVTQLALMYSDPHCFAAIFNPVPYKAERTSAK